MRSKRQRLLKERTWNIVARLGAGAFETITGEVVNVALICLSHSAPSMASVMTGVDVSSAVTSRLKALALAGEQLGSESGGALNIDSSAESSRFDFATGLGSVSIVNQTDQAQNPDGRIMFTEPDTRPRLKEHALSRTGTRTGDNRSLRFTFWEPIRMGWLQSTVKTPQVWSGCQWVLSGRAARVGYMTDALGIASIQGEDVWGSPRCCGKSNREPSGDAVHWGLFDMNAGVVSVDQEDAAGTLELPLCVQTSSSSEFEDALTNNPGGDHCDVVPKVPYEKDKWTFIARHDYPEGLPEPESDDPTQWLFHGHPAYAEGGTELQVAVARLLGYSWPAEHDKEMRLSERARGLVAKSGALLPFADSDGIVCLPAVKQEQPCLQAPASFVGRSIRFCVEPSQGTSAIGRCRTSRGQSGGLDTRQFLQAALQVLR